MKTSLVTCAALCSMAGAALPSTACAADWPQWRGPGRDGVAPDARLPASWPDPIPVKWRAAAGPGYSGPVLAGGRIYFLERSGGDEAVRCLDAQTGKDFWRTPYPAPYTVHPYAAKHGDCPKATPTVSGGRIFTLGISGILSATSEKDGKLLWKRDLGTEFACMPLFGSAASPLVDRGLVILPVGHKESGGGMMAFREATGETAWRAVSEGPSYCSPVAADLGGVRQAIGFTARHLVGVSIEDGKELWSHEVTVPFDELIVTPLVWRDRVILAARNDGGTRMLRIGRDGDKVTAEEVWRQKSPMYFSSPVIRGERLFGLEHVTGRLFCLRLADGSVVWKDGSYGDYASLVLAGDRLLVLDSGGTLTVLDPAADSLRPLAAIRVASSETYAHPAVSGSLLWIRDRSEVRCLDLGGP